MSRADMHDAQVAPANDAHVEDVLYRRVLTGMAEYRDGGRVDGLREAERALGVWVHFVRLVETELPAVVPR